MSSWWCNLRKLQSLNSSAKSAPLTRPSGFLHFHGPSHPLAAIYCPARPTLPACLPACQLGLMGNLDISSPSSSLNRSLLPLPSSVLHASRFLRWIHNPEVHHQETGTSPLKLTCPILILSLLTGKLDFPLFLGRPSVTAILGRRSEGYGERGKLPRLFRDK